MLRFETNFETDIESAAALACAGTHGGACTVLYVGYPYKKSYRFFLLATCLQVLKSAGDMLTLPAIGECDL